MQLGLSLSITQATGGAAPTSAPSNTAVPTISGIKTNGQTLTATTGSWSNSPTSFAYQWKRGVTNVGTNSSTYVLVTGDVASTMTVTVTATNAIGDGTPAVSTATSAIAAVLSISGTPVTTGTQNSAYTGFSASGAGGHTAYVYSVASGALPTGLSLNTSTGAVSGTPTVVQTATGIVIRVTDADGLTADLASFQIDVSAAGAAPVNSVAPAISGVATEGHVLTCSTGTWTGSPTFAYQWKRAGSNVGTNASTYTVVTADVGNTMTCTVTGTNGSGNASATSSATGTVLAGLLLDLMAAPASQAFSTRKLRANYGGSANRVRRNTDNTELDIGFSSGILDASALATFVGGGNDGFITKWYDQSGNARDGVQPTTGMQPRIVNAGTLQTINGHAALHFVSGNDQIPGYKFAAPSTAWWFASVASVNGDNNTIWSDGAGYGGDGIYLEPAPTNPAVVFNPVGDICGLGTGDMANGVLSTLVGVYTAGNSFSGYKDSETVTTTSTSFTAGSNTDLLLGIYPGVPDISLDGHFPEHISGVGALSGGDVTLLRANLKAAWGTA